MHEPIVFTRARVQGIGRPWLAQIPGPPPLVALIVDWRGKFEEVVDDLYLGYAQETGKKVISISLMLFVL